MWQTWEVYRMIRVNDLFNRTYYGSMTVGREACCERASRWLWEVCRPLGAFFMHNYSVDYIIFHLLEECKGRLSGLHPLQQSVQWKRSLPVWRTQQYDAVLVYFCAKAFTWQRIVLLRLSFGLPGIQWPWENLAFPSLHGPIGHHVNR